MEKKNIPLRKSKNFSKLSFDVQSLSAIERFSGGLLGTILCSESGNSCINEDRFLNTFNNKVDGLLSELCSNASFSSGESNPLFMKLAKGSSYDALFVSHTSKSKSMKSLMTTLPRSVLSFINNLSLRQFNFYIPGCFSQEYMEMFIEAILLSEDDDRFKSEKKTKESSLEKIIFFVNDTCLSKCKESIVNCMQKSWAVMFAKDLVSTPANYCNPESFGLLLKDMSYEWGLDCKIFGKEECEKMGMGAFLAVGEGSQYSPQFVHLCYKPKGEIRNKIALVGKGITMDTGGYNLKSGVGMENMKMDMGGAAAVFGCAKYIGETKPDNVEIHFISAICENMISGKAYRPGDVLTASNGKTIEVINTDAEGRLTLADALVYACQLKVEVIIDIATLTGACKVALGPKFAGLFCDDLNLANLLEKSSTLENENIWRLPLPNDYMEHVNSKIADLVNAGPGHSGAILAALFLKQFVDGEIKWAHLDIAGPAMENNKFGSGYGVKLLSRFIELYCSSKK